MNNRVIKYRQFSRIEIFVPDFFCGFVVNTKSAITSYPDSPVNAVFKNTGYCRHPVGRKFKKRIVGKNACLSIIIKDAVF